MSPRASGLPLTIALIALAIMMMSTPAKLRPARPQTAPQIAAAR